MIIHCQKTVLSAPYQKPKQTRTFHEWNLKQASDILQVYFLIKNIDLWTVGPFKQRVVEGVHDLLKQGAVAYYPWRRVGDLKNRKENVISTCSAESTPVKERRRRYKS